MDIVVEPPSRLTAGNQMTVPLVVVLRRVADQHLETSGLWMFISLLIEHADRYWMVTDSEMLQGRRVDSIHPMPCSRERGRDCVGYSSFSDLAVRRPGRYRIRVDLIDMNRHVAYSFGAVENLR